MTRAGASRILVDSSLWIEYYRPDGRPQRRSAVRDAVAQDIVATTAMVAIEVLQGAMAPDAFEALRADFGALHWLDVTRPMAERAARLGFDLHRRGPVVPFTDLMIAVAALEHECQLWHLDEHFERIARVAPLKPKRLQAGSGMPAPTGPTPSSAGPTRCSTVAWTGRPDGRTPSAGYRNQGGLLERRRQHPETGTSRWPGQRSLEMRAVR